MRLAFVPDSAVCRDGSENDEDGVQSAVLFVYRVYCSAMNVITDIEELCRILAIPSFAVRTDYPLLVPRPFVDLMERGNPNDPLLLQVLPQNDGHQAAAGFSQDPLGEIAEQCSALNKYTGRTLLLVSQECGVHCRFCFRRHFPPRPVCSDAEMLLDPLRHNTASEEIILSGGDPLMLDDDVLNRLIQAILRVKHIRRLRIHSRLPIVQPSRLTSKLAEILTVPIPVYLVLHINHPNELSADFLERRELLTKPVVMAQTVLLRKINDDEETLYRLFYRLIDARILPYYLHQLDRVEGAAHFEVDPEWGGRILAKLRERLPGYALPVYVREIYGKSCKEVIAG
jgi:EF-P beta-lysylation protein EpmB